MTEGDPKQATKVAEGNWNLGQLAALACVQEVCAPKPGNVHRGADFDDATVGDFLISSLTLVPVFAEAHRWSVGDLVYRSIRATRESVGTNTNLGIVLLLAPLARAAAISKRPLAQAVCDVLAEMTADDSRQVYAAINLAKPTGLGTRQSMDVSQEPPNDLLEAMRLAANHDRVARQYAERFVDVLETIEPNLVSHRKKGMTLSQAIVHEHVACLARWSDSLIVRKCGEAVGAQVQEWAQQVLQSGQPGQERYHEALADFDFWLRADGRRRNPGTTADLICAALFAALVQGHFQPQRWF